MDVELIERDLDSILVERFFHRLEHIEINGPVVRGFAPYHRFDVDAACGMGGHSDRRRRILENQRVFVADFFQYCLRLFEVCRIRDGKYLIDATGNASLVQALGGETEAADERERMIATLMFRISNVDLDQLDAFIHSPRLGETIRQGRESGVLKGGILAFTPIPGTRDVSLNVTRAKFDHEDLADATRGMVELRSQIEPIFRFVQREVPGLEGAYLSGIAPLAGVRDARRIRGAYRLTIEDLERMTCFEDRVACGCYPMDLHDPVTNTVVWKMLPGVYHIPYRSLLPLGMKRTLAAGKCLSADPKAFGAVRVMPIMMNVGESAGYAAALALRENKTLDQISSASLRSCLDQKYGV